MKILTAAVGLLVPLTLAHGTAPPPESSHQTGTGASTRAANRASSPGALELHFLSDTPLPQAFEWASDVAWASDRSLFLGLSSHGVVEVSLDAPGTPLQEVIPGRLKPGGFWAAVRIAASPEYLAASGPAVVLTWRPRKAPPREEMPFDTIEGIDVQGKKLAIVGGKRDEGGRYAPDGAIAWVGRLDKKLADLRPLLYDVKGPGAPMMGRCGGATGGGIRFLADGSIVVVPGVQPGIHLYSAAGKLLQTWDTGLLGIDATCEFASDIEAARVMGPSVKQTAWLNQRRVVDTVLPLPQGIGLVVRRVERGKTRWELKIVRRDGAASTIPIPVEGGGEHFHLHGAVRGDRIALLVHEVVFRWSGKDHPEPPRLLVASLTPTSH